MTTKSRKRSWAKRQRRTIALDPEQVAEVLEMKALDYANWPSSPHPTLGKTACELWGEPTGRPVVEALLDKLSAIEAGDPVVLRYDVGLLRHALAFRPPDPREVELGTRATYVSSIRAIGIEKGVPFNVYLAVDGDGARVA